MHDIASYLHTLNSNALVARDGDHICFIEDVLDLDLRWYRIEVVSTLNGEHAVAWCRYSPWALPPTTSYEQGHVFADGFICIGSGLDGRAPEHSPFDIETAIRRARFWCIAYSVLIIEGYFPNP